jgi:hypothetical protein
MYCWHFKLVLLLLSVQAGKGHARGPDLPAYRACFVCPYSRAGSSSHLMKLLRFRTAFTTARYLSVCWATWHQSTLSNPILLRSILLLFLHVRLALISGLFPSPIRATCPIHLILVNLITPQESVAYKASSLSLCHFHQLLLTLSQNIASLYHLFNVQKSGRKYLVSFVTVCTVYTKYLAV